MFRFEFWFCVFTHFGTTMNLHFPPAISRYMLWHCSPIRRGHTLSPARWGQSRVVRMGLNGTWRWQLERVLIFNLQKREDIISRTWWFFWRIFLSFAVKRCVYSYMYEHSQEESPCVKYEPQQSQLKPGSITQYQVVAIDYMDVSLP